MGKPLAIFAVTYGETVVTVTITYGEIVSDIDNNVWGNR
jgi:hypothetical protein